MGDVCPLSRHNGSSCMLTTEAPTLWSAQDPTRGTERAPCRATTNRELPSGACRAARKCRGFVLC